MAKIQYVEINFRKDRLALIDIANDVVADYATQGYTLTVRQVYYQFIARDLLPESWIDRRYNLKNGLDPQTKNTQKNYKRLASLLADARKAGLIDWDAIEDRTRNLRTISSWDDPSSIVYSAFRSYKEDFWAEQENYVEVWVEKEALAGVISRATNTQRVPFFSCRGYNSISEMHEAGLRISRKCQQGKLPYIILLTDHDPSGIDMERDIFDRLEMFTSKYGYIGGQDWEMQRIALTMEQIEQFNPPPNPAKDSDSRFKSYQEKFGNQSWELDALEPATLESLVTESIVELIDMNIWEDSVTRENDNRETLQAISDNYDDVVKFLNSKA